jgi:hypothetical protein
MLKPFLVPLKEEGSDQWKFNPLHYSVPFRGKILPESKNSIISANPEQVYKNFSLTDFHETVSLKARKR